MFMGLKKKEGKMDKKVKFISVHSIDETGKDQAQEVIDAISSGFKIISAIPTSDGYVFYILEKKK